LSREAAISGESHTGRTPAKAGAAQGAGAALEAIESIALREAARVALARCLGDVSLDGTEPEFRDGLFALARAVSSATPDHVFQPGLSLPLLRVLADRVRASLVENWSARPGAYAQAEILATLRALEAVNERLRKEESATPSTGALPSGAEFVAGVAHDLRSPLTSILFLAETLHAEQSGAINETQRRQLGIIYSAALGLVSVASDIIELVRGGEGLTERRPTPFSVTEMLESVHDIVRPMAEEKGLRVQLFPPAHDLRLGYPLALSRVLLNLTTNGLKFTESGFVELACRTVGESRVEFSVRDTGKGYSADAINDLYQPFRRSRDGKKYGFSGTGLGLAISRKLVGAMGSVLQVESRPMWGTRFFFELDLPPVPGAV
jgi:signal transduction histidine kinase